MMSNDPDGVTPATRPSLRRDDPAAMASHPAGSTTEATPRRPESSAGWRRIERAWWWILLAVMLIFSIFPIANLCLGLSTKDYGLWYQVGLAVRQGLDIYPRPESGRLFPFMYPPSAAAMLAWLSLLGPIGSLLTLVLINSVAWVACIVLSIWLACGPGSGRHPLVVIVPSLSIIVLVYNIYLLGQPNLLLLALLLGTFVCLRLGRPIGAGVLLATAAAIKAFPILALAYLIYRRMWVASAATLATLAVWLLLAPLPFRTPSQAVSDLVIWSQGMLFTYNSHGIAQRPFRSYSYKNQSIMALAHRFLRDVPADGELILSRSVRGEYSGPRPPKGLPILDPSTNVLSFPKPRAESNNDDRPDTGLARATVSPGESTGSTERVTRWDDVLQGAEPALRAAWRVNFANLNFRTVTAITVAAMLGLCVFVIAVLPPRDRRTPQTDSLEFGLVTLLTVMFSPLSFNYAYVWLIYPTTLGLHLVLSELSTAQWRRLKLTWITAVILTPALAIPMPLLAQAYGNLFLPALLLFFGFGAMLYAANRGGSGSTDAVLTTVTGRGRGLLPDSANFVGCP
jgi:alpha-1,2-mannosyltransferase